MPQLAFQPLVELGFAEIARLFNRCFEDYVVPVELTAQLKADRFRRDGSDLRRSFVTLRDAESVAIALSAPWGRTVRLAGMGVAKPARGQGVGRATLCEFLARSGRDGFREVVLEVFEQNQPAVRLYESVGFRPTQRLYGFRRDPDPEADGPTLREAGATDFVAALRASPDPVPLTNDPDQAALWTLPTRYWTVDGSALARFAVPDGDRALVLTGFVVHPQERSKGKGRQLVEAIARAYPDRALFVPQTFPEAMAGFMERVGFSRLPLNQFEMRLTF